MKSVTSVFLLVTILSLAIAVPSPSTPAPQGETTVVTSTADSGLGTLRQALLDAQDGDSIIFDPVVFPPSAPITISVTSALPGINVSNLTLDASNSGVILDGSHLSGDWQVGLAMVSCESTTIRGLQIANFSGPAIDISGDATHNVIGGDRSLGDGPFGQGNQFIHNTIGVNLATPGTTQNLITGNLMGTDDTGTASLGNGRAGVWITEGANGNTVGPDNVIAHNGTAGIFIYGPTSVNNTITRNSIHDNRVGIELQVGANTKLIFPSVLDFDLPAGTVTGATCANCTVELFSDADYEGAIYEGQTTADGSGVFVFDKGTAFIGPHLTATTTDSNGNTSPFSAPVSGMSRSLSLQEGNNLARTQIQPKQSEELADNRMGMGAAFNKTGVTGDWAERSKNKVGVKWVLALTIDYLEWPEVPANDGYSEYYIDPSIDQAVTELHDLGFEIIYSLAFWDEEIEPEECYARFKKEEEIQRYLDYVQWLVHNFKDRIQIYEMIEEPRFEECRPEFDQQNIELEDYVELTRRTIQTIHQEYPEAKIVVGANVLFHQGDYLMGILESDLMPLVDGVSWHPFYGQSPEYEPQYYYDYPATVQEIKDVASAHGFSGEYIVEEIIWSGIPDFPLTYSKSVAAKYLGRGIMMHLGMDIITGFGGSEPWRYEQQAEMRVARNLSTIMAGAKTANLPVQIQTTLTNTVSYTFALPNDDYLVALWNDGVAADYDPGITTTLTFSGFVDHQVTGIDVLYGYQQQIMTDTVGGNLVIRDLLVKDYPIILRLSPTRYVFLPIVLKAHPR
jgi:parallel beta-helix repeat protein